MKNILANLSRRADALLWRTLEDDVQWRRVRARIAWGAIALGLLLVVQTMVVYSPRFLVGALFSGREVNFQTVQSYSEPRRRQLLRNLCATYIYFMYGAEDPYRIPLGEACDAPGGLRPELVQPSKTSP